MIYVTQLIYINAGQESIFDEFEAIAITIISKYNNRILFQGATDENSFIEHHLDKPYKIV